MSARHADDRVAIGEIFRDGLRILAPEREFYVLALIYGVGVSLLSLATPISVQMLINTVANTGLTTPLVVLSMTLFVLLLFAGLLNALRIHLMEIFGRRFYARMVSEIALRALYAQNPFFLDEGKGALFNRYFDFITIQKNIPLILIGGFTLVLQAGVGFILVSLYHPLFLVFVVVMILLIWTIWGFWGAPAIRSGVGLSHSKHATAAWLQSLGASNGFFKSDRHVRYALKRTNDVTAAYIDQHARHFRHHFAQTVSFIALYAAASAALLGLGGWLVIIGQLTLGQLVAAELVLSAAFFGISQFGTYLGYFYELCASLEELSMFLHIDQEEPAGDQAPPAGPTDLAFRAVRGEARGVEARLDMTIKGGARLLARAESHGVQRLFTNLLKRHARPRGGLVAFGASDLQSMELHLLRRTVVVLDRPTVIEATIRDYLNLSCEDAEQDRVLEALRVVGLYDAVAGFEHGLDTRVFATGWPLSVAEIMQLKLAAALLAKPRVVVLNQLFDVMDETVLSSALSHFPAETTIIYFTNRRSLEGVEGRLSLGSSVQRIDAANTDPQSAAEHHAATTTQANNFAEGR